MAIRQRVGLILPSVNTTCEPDFYMVAPKDVTIHTQRMWCIPDSLTKEGMDRMNADMEAGARYLATAKVKVIAYGCTTGSFYKGPGWDREMLEQISQNAGGVPAVATAPAVVEALKTSGAKRLSVVTPYPEWPNQRLKAYLEALGFEGLHVDGHPRTASGALDISDQDPEEIVEFGAEKCRPEADALFCSCTAWRALEAVDELEQRTGKPVVTSNQANIWATFRKAGINQPIYGFGKLLESL